MEFFRRKKKKDSSRDSPTSLPTRTIPSVLAEPGPPTTVVEQLTASGGSDPASTPPEVVEEPTSLFKGLLLSSNVRKQDGHDSPYLARVQPKQVEDENEPSPFDFLTETGCCGGREGAEEKEKLSQIALEADKPSEGLTPETQAGGDDGKLGVQGEGEGEEQFASAFGFISQEPPQLPHSEEGGEGGEGVKKDGSESNEVSGLSALLSGGPQSGEPLRDSEEKERERGKNTEQDDGHSVECPPLIPHEPPLLLTATSPATTALSATSSSAPNKTTAPPLQPAFPSVRNSSGAASPVPGPISPPLTSSPLTPATHPPPAARMPVGKQQPSTGKKRKKRKVMRPGQERMDDVFSRLMDPSTGDDTSSPGGGDGGGVGSKTEPDSVSLASQTSSVEGGRDQTSVASSLSELHGSVTKTTTDGGQGEGTRVQAREGEGEGEGVTAVAAKSSETGVGTETADGGGRGGGGDSGEVEDGQPDRSETGLLVDLSNAGKGQRDGEVEEGRQEEGGGAGFADQQLLVEVFTGDSGGRGGDREEEGKVGKEASEGEGRSVGEGRKEAEGVNYSVELTASDKLIALLQSSDSNLASIRLDLSELHTQKQSSLDQHISAAREQRQRREQVRELRASEARALSEEDYELAEELRGKLEAVSQDSSWSIASASHTLLREWLREVCEMMRTEERMQTNIRSQLTEMREEQSQALASTEEKIASTHTKQKMKLKALEDKIVREKGHIALDREHLQKREQQLQEEIASRAETFISKKSTLQKELSTVTDEISELEAKLAGLRQEEARLLTAISEEEGRIEAVHQELEAEDSSLCEERDSLSRRDQQLQAEQDEVDQVRQEHEAAQQVEVAEKQSISGVLGRVDVKWANSERRTHTLAQCLSRAGDLAGMDTSTLLSPSEYLQRHRKSVAVKEEEVKAVTSQLLSLQTLISQLRRQITQTEERLPQLEEAKKAAIAARQYHEAGRVSSELKQLRAELEAQRQQVAESNTEVSGKSQQLSALNAELVQEREGLEHEECQEDTGHVKQLACALAKIQATKASIPESSSPVNPLLDCWHQLYKLLAEGLCTKHDLQLADFTPHMELQEEEEGEGEGANNDTGGTSHEVEKTQKPPEERTPGVGREVQEEEGGGGEGEGDGEGEGGEGAPSRAEVEEVRRKIAELETRIEEAVSDDVENYELAAELDKELSQLRETLKSTDPL